MDYNLSAFSYNLPKELIASTPTEERDASRLLAVDIVSKQKELHGSFSNIKSYFSRGDVLVLNNSKVFPSRLFVQRASGAKIEFLLLHQDSETGYWQAMGKNISKLKEKEELQVIGCEQKIIFLSKDEQSGHIWVQAKNCKMSEIISQSGEIPLPPYMNRQAGIIDEERYQTVYAKDEGSVAAPTAGLHFTHQLLQEIKQLGVEVVFVTLHVGAGTFLPVKKTDIREHRMHTEHYTIEPVVKKTIEAAKKKGGRIFAVGTTTTRCLESSFSKEGGVYIGEQKTNIFIFPPYQFQVVDCLITNFHLPGSSLLMLVSAFCDLATIKDSYEWAIRKEMRFFSYGDAMLLFTKH